MTGLVEKPGAGVGTILVKCRLSGRKNCNKTKQTALCSTCSSVVELVLNSKYITHRILCTVRCCTVIARIVGCYNKRLLKDNICMR